MHVLISGATGFVGIGVLAEALSAPDVTAVTVLGRRPTGVEHSKLTELVVGDMADLSGIADQLAKVDVCFWCLGISSGGLDEATYTHITYTLAMHAARTLLEQNPNAQFCFLSGSGADGKAMWAQVKKRTEDELGALGLASVVVFRPAFIRGLHGAQLRGALYKFAYALFTPLTPLIRLFGGATSNAEIGRAMIVAAREGMDGETLDSGEINSIAARL
ncbi:MAG: NAD(P)H-binding protein [Thermoanaerobaculia bacterium]|nr:NAD(P)H-binding protein [Thermoanaerobaculia bacterium]